MPLSVSIVGAGRPIVLLPGFALDGAVMAAAFEPAVADVPGWQRIYLDLPGTGGSPAGEPTSEAVLDEIRATVADLIGDTPYRLVGHSYGGYLATGLARRDPDQVAGMFLWCCGLRIRPGDRDLTGVQPSVPEPGWLDGVPDELQEHFEHAIGLQTRAGADRVAAAFARRGPLDDAYLAALRPAGYQLADEPEPADLGPGEGNGPPPFTGPVSILSGRRDRIAGYRDPVAMLRHFPNADVTVLAHAGHYLPFERPEILVTQTRSWLASMQ